MTNNNGRSPYQQQYHSVNQQKYQFDIKGDEDTKWKTNTVMAGMFSMLHQNHVSSESGQMGPGGSSWEEGNGERNIVGGRTPVMGRRAVNHNKSVRFNMSGDKLPKSMRQQRFEELHPVLRRSVCTLILAGICVTTGIIFILVNYLTTDNEDMLLAYIGFITAGIGGFLILIGVVWFRVSKSHLRRAKKKAEQAKINKMKKPTEKCNELEVIALAKMTSKHINKWPSRENCSADNCRETFTSPNGNHFTSSQRQQFPDLHEDVAGISRHAYSSSSSLASSLQSNTSSATKSALGVQLLPKVQRFPIRINKKGEVVPTESNEIFNSRTVSHIYTEQRDELENDCNALIKKNER